jgi:hypothetical protein
MQIKVKWKQLNEITLGQKETDNFNQLIIISESTTLGIKREIRDLSIWISLITLTY